MRYVMDSSFLTGCDQVDSQHAQLFEAINGLLDTCEKGANLEALQKSLDFLSDYTIKHFFDEEQLLKKNGFSGIDNHRHFHEAFKKTVRELSHEFIFKGASEKLVNDVQGKIGTWLIEHIKGQDFRWAKELKEKAPGMFSHTFKAPASLEARSSAVSAAASAVHEGTASRTRVATQPGGAGKEVTVKKPAAPAFTAAPKPAAQKTAAAVSAPSAASAPGAYTRPSQTVKKHSATILVKMTLFYTAVLFAVIAFMAALGVINMRDLARDTAVAVTETKLKGDMASLKQAISAAYGVLYLENGRLTGENGVVLDSRAAVVEKTARDLGIGLSVLIRDGSSLKRVATTLLDPSGKNLEGVPLTNAALEPLLTGSSYTGEILSDGVRYFGNYEPLFAPGAGREVIGALFAGVETSAVDQIIKSRSERLILIITLTSISLLVIVTLASRGALEILFNRPIKRISGVLSKVGGGDIAQQIRLRPGDEIGDIAGQFDRTLDNLKRLVTIIRNEAEAVDETGVDLSNNMNKTTAAMNEISAEIQDIQKQVSGQTDSVQATNAAVERITGNIEKLNSEIEEQTESVSQSSQAIEKMLASIESVTRISRTNSENVVRLAEASDLGKTSLQAVANDMQEIARESEGLLEINSVLQNIASQTNLLSMNAAIEAAHAGESGKGFAVVADEIRKLAESSSDQSKTISNVLKKIKDSITKISFATGEVLDRFGAIETDVKTVSDQEDHIRSAMEQQSSGSKQILEAIGKLNDITRAVKSTSDEMQEGNREIINEGQNLKNVTGIITGKMNEIAARAGEVNNVVNRVNDISAKSSSNITILKDAISSFVVKDQHYVWDESLAVGVKKIDEQHIQLFDAINSLMDAIESGHGAAGVRKALDFLVSYTGTHFADEEAIQKACGYPDFENHRNIHEVFKKSAAAMAEEFKIGADAETLVKEVKRKFGDLLIAHIEAQDLKLRDYIKQTGHALP